MSVVKKEGVEYNKDSENPSGNFVRIPVSLFMDRSLSVLEVLVEYLKEEMHFTFHEIAVMTNRDDRTIWTVYSRVKKKREKKSKPELQKSEVFVPLSVLLDRTLSVLEVLVEYLKEKLHLTYHEIAVLTNRNDRTIWTVYDRARKKRMK
ncbi:hypothetical protein KY330_01230 [Candidatus Woesearchaeota archaeon]|nr:hypothetical protein [Candidatus Woesearchaeota archaeon]